MADSCTPREGTGDHVGDWHDPLDAPVSDAAERSERFHALRWRWRYFVVWRLWHRRGPL